MFVVAGASGHTGRAAAESLIERGQAVRVLVRDPEKGEEWRRRGAEVAVASLDDADTLAKAFRGSDGAYVLLPPAYHLDDVLGAQARVAHAIAGAIRSSGIPHVVLLSSIGAQHSSGTGFIRALHHAEQALRPAATNLTILRPCYFIENWALVLSEAREKSVLPTFLTPERRIPMIATRDVGRAAARALMEPAAGCRILELAGPREWSPQEVAREIGAILQREVRLLPLPLEAAAPAMTSLGMSPGSAALFQEMTGSINSGRVAFEGAPEENWRGTAGVSEVIRPILDAGGSEGV
jgi:uncharacterized protein YbjT (DUF2867 family)